MLSKYIVLPRFHERRETVAQLATWSDFNKLATAAAEAARNLGGFTSDE